MINKNYLKSVASVLSLIRNIETYPGFYKLWIANLLVSKQTKNYAELSWSPNPEASNVKTSNNTGSFITDDWCKITLNVERF